MGYHGTPRGLSYESGRGIWGYVELHLGILLAFMTELLNPHMHVLSYPKIKSPLREGKSPVAAASGFSTEVSMLDVPRSKGLA